MIRMLVILKIYLSYTALALVALALGRSLPVPDGAKTSGIPSFIGQAATPKPLPPKAVAQHPLLAVTSCIHSDSYNSDVDDYPGPLGINPEVRTSLLGMCPIIMFDPAGRLIAVSFDPKVIGLGVSAIDPQTLKVIDRYGLPMDFSKLFTGGAGSQGISVNGAYFHVDRQGRALVGTQDNRFLELELRETPLNGLRWAVRRSIDLQPHLPNGHFLIDTLYDWDGNVWFASTEGVVGYMDRTDGAIRTVLLAGEFVENGLAAAEDGLFVLTSEAAYRFEIDPTSREPLSTWRVPYDRGTVAKPGTFALGSGTTPTLLGDDLIVFTDNADVQVNLLVFRRGKNVSGDRLVASVPLFEPGASAVDVSMIAYGNSIVVENIYNAGTFLDDYRQLAPGLTRVDVLPDRSGCEVKWSLPIRSTTVPKLSTATGLIYTYTQSMDYADPVDAWYFTAVDFETGKIVFQVLAGTGPLKNNSFGAIAIGPDGTAYQGIFGGLVAVRDRLPASPPAAGNRRRP